MTARELIKELEKLPEDCEIVLYNKFLNWTAAIDSKEPISAVEHDTEINSFTAYIYGN